MGLAEVVVVDVVGGGYLQTAGAELDVHVAVLDDRHLASHEGHDDAMAAKPLVLRVFGVDAHGGVAHDGLWTRGCDDGIVAFLVFMHNIALLLFGSQGLDVDGSSVCKIVFQVVEFRTLLLVFHLFGGEGGEGLRVPVNHAQAAIDEALVIEVYEDLGDALAAGVVHGEGRAVPVAAGTEFAQLLQDDAAVLMGPLPSVLEELLTGEVVLLDALLGEQLHHLGFGSDRGVVGSGHPAGVLTLHTGTAHQHILDSVVEHVSHMQHAGDVGWRNDYRVGHTVVRFRVEEFLVKPELIPFLLDGARVVL